jgi:hypothetical protein
VELMVEERDTKVSNSITPMGKFRYLFGLLIILGAAYSQYLLGGFGPVLGFLVVYGIPIVVVSILWGRTLIQKAGKNTRTAFRFGLVYGVASAIDFTDLATFGMAMCVTYYLSGGNLLVPAVLHGAYDATGFLGVATSSQIGAVLRVLMMLVGIAVALSLLISRRRERTSRTLCFRRAVTAAN